MRVACIAVSKETPASWLHFENTLLRVFTVSSTLSISQLEVKYIRKLFVLNPHFLLNHNIAREVEHKRCRLTHDFVEASQKINIRIIYLYSNSITSLNKHSKTTQALILKLHYNWKVIFKVAYTQWSSNFSRVSYIYPLFGYSDFKIARIYHAVC
jgi:hypothetical protein